MDLNIKINKNNVLKFFYNQKKIKKWQLYKSSFFIFLILKCIKLFFCKIRYKIYIYKILKSYINLYLFIKPTNHQNEKINERRRYIKIYNQYRTRT